KFVPPLILDNISVNLGNWSGYHVLAQHQPKSASRIHQPKAPSISERRFHIRKTSSYPCITGLNLYPPVPFAGIHDHIIYAPITGLNLYPYIRLGPRRGC
ncbi:MAG: hypothetical protein AAGU14_10080, partial [Eubacteriaceae bacterium]